MDILRSLSEREIGNVIGTRERPFAVTGCEIREKSNQPPVLYSHDGVEFRWTYNGEPGESEPC